jgi:hypothetical protein
MEYLVTMTTHVPGGTSAETVQEVRTREGRTLAPARHRRAPAPAVASTPATGRMAHAPGSSPPPTMGS